MEPGETPEEALKREWMEEMEIPVTVGELICEGAFTHFSGNIRLMAFRVELAHENFRMHEHTEYRWVTLPELNAADLADSDKIIADYLNTGTVR